MNKKLKKKIWFVSHYSMPPEYEFRHKTQEWAKRLQDMGYDVKIISSSFLHNYYINLIEDNSKYSIKEYDGLEYIHINTVEYKKTGIKRILNLFSFGKKFYKMKKKFGVPDVIVADVNCINYKYVAKYSKKHKVKLILDIRDLWPLSIVEHLNFSNNNPFIKYLYRREKDMYYKADDIIFSMEGGRNYIIEKGWTKSIRKPIALDKIHHINNGVDYFKFKNEINEYKFSDPDLDSNKFKVVYTGSINDVNNVKKLIDTANLLKNHDNEIMFLIYGSGDQLEDLKKYVQNYKVFNIKFKGVVNKNTIPYILSKSNLNIFTYPDNNLKKYGSSLNKMFEYFASGKPTLSDSEFGYDIIKKYNAGFVVDNATSEELSSEIIKIKNMNKDKYNQICLNAEKAAQEYDFKILTNKLKKIIER